jgi:hypothetical protein
MRVENEKIRSYYLQKANSQQSRFTTVPPGQQREETRRVCRHSGGHRSDGSIVKEVAINPEGLQLLAGGRVSVSGRHHRKRDVDNDRTPEECQQG